MPIAKDKCICQICICGRHNCDRTDKNVLHIDSDGKLMENFNDNNLNNDQNDQYHTTPTIELPIIIETNQESLRSPPIISLETSLTSEKQLIIDSSSSDQPLIRHKRSNEPQMIIDDKMQATTDDQQPQQPEDNPDEQRSSNQRQTWKTSPEQVEELTRSLSRIRNDEHGNRTYQKSKTKTKATTTTKTTTATGKKPSSKVNKVKRNHNNQYYHQQPQAPQYMLPVRVVSTTRLVNTMNHDDSEQSMMINNSITDHNDRNNQKIIDSQQPPAATNGFLPPITGFSDTDSSFSSVACSVDDCDKIHCICETLKQTHLEEHRQDNFNNDDGQQYINYYNNNDIDQDNWIVVRPSKRTKPKDNLKLEGPMELETTFRSTYGQQQRRSGNSDNSKYSNYSDSNSQQQQFYFNTKRGRHSGNTPLLRSATKRKTLRNNRPKTSLKTGGHGYWSTNNRDAYKNFIIVNGEAKTINDSSLKLPKVTRRTTTLMKNEEKNRCKYNLIDNNYDYNDDKSDKNPSGKPLRLVDGELKKKFEKKTLIQTSDGQNELMAEKLVRKIRHHDVDGHDDDHDHRLQVNKTNDDDIDGEDKITKTIVTDDNDDQQQQNKQKQEPQSKTMKHRPYDAYYVDNIKELGLLQMNDDNDNDVNDYNEDNLNNSSHRSHISRRLHETSDDFHILTGGFNKNNHKPREQVKMKNKGESKSNGNDMIKQQQPQQQPKQTKIMNGHALIGSSNRPFILPQRIQRHKNECSIPLFNADDHMEFTTTTASTYRRQRLNSGRKKSASKQQQQSQPERKRTAGRRTLRSGRRRNLFRQSSDSIFARPDTADNADKSKSQSNGQQAQQQQQQKEFEEKTIYKTEFGDRSLYCPALDVINPVGPNDPFKMTGETGGHRYYVEK